MKKILFILAMLSGALLSSAQWNDSSENTLIASATSDDIYLAATSDGGVYFTYGIYQDSNIKKYLQLTDCDGNKLFGDDGLLIADETTTSTFYKNRRMLITDADDNAIVVVYDNRLGSKSMTYTAYKVSPDGEMLWGDSGITFNRGEVSDAPGFMNILPLSDGSFIFSWTVIDRLAHVEIERISADGQFIWSAPLRIGDTDDLVVYSWLLPSIDDTFLIVYTQNRNYDFAVRRYNADGTTVWDNDVVIYDGGFDNQPVYTFSDFISDGNGGVIAAWRYTLDPDLTANFKAQIAQVNADGSYGLGRTEKGGLPLDDTTNANTSVRLAYSPADNCVYACYYETVSTAERLILQKLDMQGNRLYGTQGKRNDLLTQSAINQQALLASDNGDLLILYTYMPNQYSSHQLLCAMRIDPADGSTFWPQTSLVSSVESSKRNIHATPIISNHHCIAAWQDERIDDSYDLYAQPVSLDYAPSGIPAITTDLPQCHAHIVDGTLDATIHLAVPDHLTLDLYDLTGAHIRRLCSAPHAAGTHHYSAPLTPGLYLLKATTSTATTTLKVK